MIEDYVDIIIGIYRNYCIKPTWEKLQLMFRNILLLGVEIGRQQAFQSMEENKKPIKKVKEHHRTLKSDTPSYLDFNGKNELVHNCEDNLAARRLTDRIRKHVSTYHIEAKVYQKGSQVLVEKIS